jgi:hypothetical protein
MKRSYLRYRDLAFVAAVALTATLATSGAALAAEGAESSANVGTQGVTASAPRAATTMTSQGTQRSKDTADGIIEYDPEVTDPRGRDIPATYTVKPRGVSSRSFLKCPISGQVCLHTPARLDDNNQTWATFQLWEYGTYSLSGFNYAGQSELQNNQFDSATAITERRDHSDIACFPAAGSYFYAVNYYPVWHVELSPVQRCL